MLHGVGKAQGHDDIGPLVAADTQMGTHDQGDAGRRMMGVALLSYAVVWVIALAAWQADHPEFICSPRLVLAHVWEDLEM